MKAKRPCVIFVADSNMASTFRGYFARDQWHLRLGCSWFDFNSSIGGDLLVDDRNDPGVYTRCHEILRSYQGSHHRVLVVLDCEWGGSPGQAKIVEHVTANLENSGWSEESVKVIAIEPELENWLWQDNPHVAEALRYKGQPTLRQWLAQAGLWPEGAAKPPRPKEAAEWVLKQTRHPRSSSIYEQLAARVSIHGCTDAAFLELHQTLKAWFPAEIAT